MLKNYQLFLLPKNTFKLNNLRFLHKEQKINVNGININIIQTGEGEKTVFLLPGTMGTAKSDFAPQLENLPKLLKRHKIIAWDPPGYGNSVPPERQFNTNCFQNDAKCAVELMRKLSIDKFSMIGWSAGAMTAMIIAGRYPELVERLVIWGAGAYFSEEDFKLIKEFRDVRKLSPTVRENFERVYGEQRFSEMWCKCMDTLGAIYTNNDGDVCSEEAKKIKAPTFILRGKKDIVNSENHLSFLFKHLPCYKYFEFPEGKHNIHLRYSNEFNKMVADFLLLDSTQLAENLDKHIKT